MDEIVCANTAFRYWRCPPQVRNLYPRLPSPEDGWRALAQAPFVTDILKTPIITTTVPGGVNYHSGLRTTIHCDDASGVDSTLETAMSFRVTNPLATLFTMARFMSPTDLVLAMYEFCGWFPYSTSSHGGVAQLGERLTGSQEVRGSIPLVSTRALNEAPTQVGAFFHIGTQGQRRHHDPPGRQDRKKLRRARPL